MISLGIGDVPIGLNCNGATVLPSQKSNTPGSITPLKLASLMIISTLSDSYTQPYGPAARNCIVRFPGRKFIRVSSPSALKPVPSKTHSYLFSGLKFGILSSTGSSEQYSESDVGTIKSTLGSLGSSKVMVLVHTTPGKSGELTLMV